MKDIRTLLVRGYRVSRQFYELVPTYCRLDSQLTQYVVIYTPCIVSDSLEIVLKQSRQILSHLKKRKSTEISTTVGTPRPLLILESSSIRYSIMGDSSIDQHKTTTTVSGHPSIMYPPTRSSPYPHPNPKRLQHKNMETPVPMSPYHVERHRHKNFVQDGGQQEAQR